MSLIPFTFNVSRDTVTDDVHGGETTVAANAYTGLSGTFNFYVKDSTFRYESQGGGETGPGVQSRNIGVVIMDPKPDNVTFLINDRVVVTSSGSGVPAALAVTGIRVYEVSLQLDVEVFLP